jgi:hypothetical protein
MTRTTPAISPYSPHLKLAAGPFRYPVPEPGRARDAYRGRAARDLRQACQPGILFPELADPVDAHLDRFLIEDTVAALIPLPYPCPAQFGGEYPRVGTGMTQFIGAQLVQVHVGHEPRTTANGRYGGSQETKLLGRG